MTFLRRTYSETFNFPMDALKTLGVMKFEKNCLAAARTFQFLYCTWSLIFLTIFTFSSICNLFKVINDIALTMTSLMASICVAGIWLKSIFLLPYHEGIQMVQRRLNRTLNSDTRIAVREIYYRAALEMRIYCRIIYSLLVILFGMWILSGVIVSISKNSEVPPLPIWIPWNFQDGTVYLFTVIYSTYGAFLVGLNGVSTNLMIFGSILQMCAEYEVLEKKAAFIAQWCYKLNEKRTEPLTPGENFKIKGMVVSMAKHHQKVINCVDKLAGYYVHIFLLQFIMTGSLVVIITLDIILLSKKVDSKSSVPPIFLVLLWFDIFLFCSYGTRLKNKSFNFLNVVYFMPWELMDTNNRDLLRIIMIKAQRPPKFTVEKVSDLDFGSFMNLAKFVYNFVYLAIQLSDSHHLSWM